MKQTVNNELPLVGVYGEVSVGKSTFLNALLKNKVFDSSLGETTKKVYVMQHKDSIKRAITHQSIPIEYKQSEISLLTKFSIVDIPGSNKSFSSDQVKSAVENLEVIVWLHELSKDISPEHKKFIQDVKGFNIKIIVFFNKIDGVFEDIDSDEVADMLQQVKNRKNWKLPSREQLKTLLTTEKNDWLYIKKQLVKSKELAKGGKYNFFTVWS